jgi:hypothetical protein
VRRAKTQQELTSTNKYHRLLLMDPNQYANAILAGEPYPPHSQHGVKTTQKAPDPPAKEDISFAISKLNFGIDDVSKEIKTLVSFLLIVRR